MQGTLSIRLNCSFNSATARTAERYILPTHASEFVENSQGMRALAQIVSGFE